METLTKENNTAIVKADEFTKLISEKKEAYSALTIKDFNDKEGYNAIDVARKDIKKIRVEIEKFFKADRDILNVAVKANLSKEKEILSIVTPLELELKAKTDVVDNEKQRIADEKAAKEKARIDARFEKINKLGLTFDGSNYSYKDYRISVIDIQTVADETIDNFIYDVLTDKENEEKIKAEAAEKLAKEQAEIAANQKAEAERLEAIKIEQEKKEAEFKAEQEKIAKENAEREAKIKEQQDALDAEKKKAEQAKIDAENEKKRLEELEQAKREAAEKATREAEAKAKADAEAKELAEKQAAEKKRLEELEEQRQLALRPDKEKLKEFAENIMFNTAIPVVDSEGAKTICKAAKAMFQEIEAYVKKETAKL